MDLRQFPEDKKKAVLGFLESLLQENRRELLELVNQKVIPPEKQELLIATGAVGSWWPEVVGARPEFALGWILGFITFVSAGGARLDARDYDQAIALFPDAVNQKDAPEQMVAPPTCISTEQRRTP